MRGILPRLARLYHTVRHLKPVQVYGRLWFRLYRPRPDLRPAPEVRPATSASVAWASRRPSMRSPDTFSFLNQEGTLDRGWDDPGQTRLWRYNLHYFDDLNADDSAARTDWHQALIERWIADNPPGHGSGWEPYPLSLRVVNWIKWQAAGNRLEEPWLQSLAVQTRYLAARLEHHILGNHLFVNAKALVFAGLFFQGHEARGWLDRGLAILARETAEQILADGGHFERSPMYHALILEDVLDLINLAGQYGSLVPRERVAEWEELACRVTCWLRVMTHPDGEISFFNDAAMGIAPPPGELHAYAARLGVGAAFIGGLRVVHLCESGYIRVANDCAVALLDVGPVGPEYLPGHAHADTLSFEWSLFGQRAVVNCGISCYGVGAERVRQRGTAAHSTVEIAGCDSSEVWGGFRVARRAYPFDLSVEENGGAVAVRCAHTGYCRLPGNPVHRRQWAFADRSLRIIDRVEGGQYEAVARYHLHPSVVVQMEGDVGRIVLPDGQVAEWRVLVGAARLAASSYHPEFGLSLPCQCLEVALVEQAADIVFTWG